MSVNLNRRLLIIGGVDVTPYIAENGYKITRNDIDGPNAGRTLDGTMVRDRVAVKMKIEVKGMRLPSSITQRLLNLIYSDYVVVDYIDPRMGMVNAAVMYSNNVSATCVRVVNEGNGQVEYWDEISFPLIEV